MTQRANRGGKQLARRLCGFGAMVVAAVASIATSSGPDQTSVSLPDAAIDFALNAPETRRQFRVESDEGSYSLTIRVTTDNSVSPWLQLQALDDAGEPVELKPLPFSHHEAGRAELYVRVTLPCPRGRFPCGHRFVVIASADALSEATSTGVLSITARFVGGFHEDAYLAIEPL